MSNYKGHLAGGLFAYFIVLYFIIAAQTISLATGFEWLLFTLAGALFPDVDIKSKGQKIFYYVMLVLMLVLIVHNQTQTLVIVAILAMVPLLVRHRGIFHKLGFVLLVPLIIGVLLCSQVPHCSRVIMHDVLFFIAGAISHLWLDFGFFRMLGLK